MQELSFKFDNTVFSYKSYEMELFIYTFENVFGLDKSSVCITENQNGLIVECERLVWAGGQEKAEGMARIEINDKNGGFSAAVWAAHGKHVIRCVKLVIRNLPGESVANKLDLSNPIITDKGISLKYPGGWRTLDTAMCLLKYPGGYTCLRSADDRVRDKKFVLFKKDSTVTAELIFEETASIMNREVSVPAWEIFPCKSVDEAYEIQKAHISSSFSLEPWETRRDVPAWAKEISLVASIHGQHWSGRIFNDYRAMLCILEQITEYIDGKRVLAYISGWEGRYYWKYGDYTTDERMGGDEGFAHLAEGAKKLGVHLMPMFGINIVNPGLPNFEQWGEPSRLRTPSGAIHAGSVDWDASRHYDHNSHANLNPAAPQWQTYLVNQIRDITDKYGLDAVFLDIGALWQNDPNHELYSGVKRLVERIRDNKPNMFLSGEGWYDGLAAIFPAVQSGHTDGLMHYHDTIYPPFFDTWCRNYAHLCLGDPGSGSTGTHELGFNNVNWKTPLRKGVWPTVTIVGDTLENGWGKVLEIIDDAKRYAEMFL